MNNVTKEKNFVSAVVYLHNEEKKIGKFLNNLYNELDEHFTKFEIIIVNDSCEDNSVKIVKDFADEAKDCVISILNMSYYQGVELAMNAGVDLSIGDFVYEFDSIDMDYNKEWIMKVYYESLKGFDIVSASANKNQQLSSKIFYKIFNKFANMQYMLETETFRILSRRAINRVHAMSKTIPYRKAIYSNCGLKLHNIKYDSIDLEKKKEKKTDRKMKENLAVDSLVLFTDVAYRFTSIMTLIMILITIGVGIYTGVVFIAGNPIAGWTTLMLFLAFGFFGLFAIFSIVMKYLSLILNLTFKKQKYVFESIDKISK